MSYSARYLLSIVGVSVFFLLFVMFVSAQNTQEPSIRQSPLTTVKVCNANEYATITEQGLVCVNIRNTAAPAPNCGSDVTCCGTREFVRITPNGLACARLSNIVPSTCGDADPACSLSACTNCCGTGLFAVITANGLECRGIPYWDTVLTQVVREETSNYSLSVLSKAHGTPNPVVSVVGTLPDWLSFSNGILSGTAPSITSREEYFVTLKAQNDAGNAEQTINITVIEADEVYFPPLPCISHADCPNTVVVFGETATGGAYCNTGLTPAACEGCTWSEWSCSGDHRTRFCGGVNGKAEREHCVNGCNSGICLRPTDDTCTSDDQCLSGDCSADGLCQAPPSPAVSPDPLSCTSNDQCASRSCDTVTNTCNPLCTTHNSCSGNTYCTAVSCTAGWECDGAYRQYKNSDCSVTNRSQCSYGCSRGRCNAATPASYPPSGYPPASYPPSGYPPASYPPSGYPPASYPPSGYPPASYPPSGYPPASYPPSGYPPASYPPSGYPPRKLPTFRLSSGQATHGSVGYVHHFRHHSLFVLMTQLFHLLQAINSRHCYPPVQALSLFFV